MPNSRQAPATRARRPRTTRLRYRALAHGALVGVLWCLPGALTSVFAADTAPATTATQPARIPPLASPTPADPWRMCRPQPGPVPSPVPSVSGKGRIDVFARKAHIVRDGLTRFTGGVIAHRDGQQLEADQATYRQADRLFQAKGNVRYFNNGFSVTADQAHMDLTHETGELNDTHYRLARRHARGKASHIVMENRNLVQLQQADYTTCLPGKTDWIMNADTLTLDQSTGQGTAHDVVLRFKGVPFLYLPYLRFPISDARMSGLLFPSFGTTSQTGTDLSLPYYWNIAPNRDATLTPRFMSRRGLMLENEFRYLNENNRGEVRLDYLPNDKLAHRDRMLFSWQHQGAPTAGWSTDVNYNYVSDPLYFDELGTGINTTSVTYLERRADLRYNSADWALLTRVQGYQTLVGTRPYERLPQLTLDYLKPQPDNHLNYLFSGEAVRFANAGLSPVGTRVDLQPGISLPLRTSYGFLDPRLILRHTQYWLTGTSPGQNTVLTRDLPIFSVDSGLYFERNTRFGSTPMIQTLEPRLYYLHVPYHDQSALPVFDTARYDFSFAQLFRDNRFSGPDRVGDANQLTAALTTRLLRRADGSEWLSASLGQAFYFQNRRVTLPGALPDTQGNSALVGGLSWRPGHAWYLSTDLQWDPTLKRTDIGGARIQYRPDHDHIINAAYRYYRGQLENTDLSFVWPLSARWHAFGRWQYSLRDKLTQEQLLGVQYDSCCWGLRVLSRRYLNPLDGTTSSAVYLELQLKGLSSLGDRKRIEGLLERGILGYGDASQ